jgi:hypothetical protein
MPHPQLLMEIESFDLNCIRMMKLLVAARHSHSGCATRANHIVIADLNGDGRPDVSACAEARQLRTTLVAQRRTDRQTESDKRH